jgi:predicted transcriptional regulator
MCEEEARLASEYEITAKKYANAVSELNKKMGTSAKSEYERLARAADEARVKSEQARLALEQHVAAHSC